MCDSVVQAGYSPLHTACYFGQINVVEYLLRHGASTEAVTKVGHSTATLYCIACKKLFFLKNVARRLNKQSP